MRRRWWTNAVSLVTSVVSTTAATLPLHALSPPSWVTRFTWTVVWGPLYHLYRHGPCEAGMWCGKSADHICAELTNVDALHWIESDANRATCDALIAQRFDSLSLIVGTVVYGVLVFQAARVMAGAVAAAVGHTASRIFWRPQISYSDHYCLTPTCQAMTCPASRRLHLRTTDRRTALSEGLECQ